ncbi:hypothetical protein BN2476_960130 [Paraburkholderia piptadeniae]|uniref:HAD family hydrolase n=2 Tax=Paraburkholderia TaxID=1822464 RepID=A0A7X1NEB4_9BURK|nr:MULTISPECIES: hypothetical protein [Paraburkholderia]MPW20392.1 hypothetical protein [Paraburkholderia franconis]SIT50979.1 hypothetical protein BN2476_960130 [Paraburkholderia piptadeniae]
MSVEAFILCLDDVLIDSVAEPKSVRLVTIRDDINAAIDGAVQKGIKLALVSGMVSHNVVVACEKAFTRDFIKIFSVVVPCDGLGLSELPLMERALLYLGVSAECAIAIICNEVDAIAAKDAGISRHWHLDVPEERDAW